MMKEIAVATTFICSYSFTYNICTVICREESNRIFRGAPKFGTSQSWASVNMILGHGGTAET